MKPTERTRNALPHVIASAYVAILGSMSLSTLSVRAGSLLALLLLVVLAYSRKREDSLSPIEKGYLLYLAVNVIGFWIMPERAASVLKPAPAAFLYAAFLVTGAAPALFGGQYFTEFYARKTTPEAVWETEPFRKINRNMSLVWALLFAVSLVAAVIPVVFSLQRGLWTALGFQVFLPGVLMLGIGTTFNKKYPGYYQRKMGIEPVSQGQVGFEGPLPARPEREEMKKERDMSNRLKVVAINGSPHAAGGNTSIMTQMMASVLAAEGIDLEEIFLAEKHMEYCLGCGVCMEKGKCWRRDDHAEVLQKALDADGVILASPVYFNHVTAQMKTFLDRSLAYGHKPRASWKPGLAVSVSAGKSETSTAAYLASELAVYGAFSTGTLTAIAVGPGAFLGKELVEARAADLARDLARAIKEKRRYPATEHDLSYYLFMGELVRREKDFMRDDYKHWQESGFYDGFESYIGQSFSKPPYDEGMRKEWIKGLVANDKGRAAGIARQAAASQTEARVFASCRELLQAMPLGFKKEAAGNMKATYQFEISGTESFVARIEISDGACVYADGPGEKPDVIIKSPAEVWLAVSRGEMNGQAAFMSGKFKVEGNIGLLMKLGSLFG
jgi:multimeric flavodoxin WrbA/putative sterol carrier protein